VKERFVAGFQNDITRSVLAVLFIGVLIGTSLWILRPFLGAAIWAVTIATATWPLMISIGIFVGPVVLAVAHTLLSAWIDEDNGEKDFA